MNMLRKLLVALLIAALGLTGAAMADAKVTVQGSGTVLMDADRATIRVGVRETAADVIAAQSAVNERIQAVVEAMTAMGVDAGDIYTNMIGIYPNYDYSGETERITNYTAYNDISVITSDIADVGKYIDAAFEAGANTLDGVSFSASDTTDAVNQALALAMSNAMEKAKALAEAAGMELSGIDEIRESYGYSGGNSPVMYARTESAKDAGTRVMASQLEITACVEVQFELK